MELLAHNYFALISKNLQCTVFLVLSFVMYTNNVFVFKSSTACSFKRDCYSNEHGLFQIQNYQ